MSIIESYEKHTVMTPTMRRDRREEAVSARRNLRMKATALVMSTAVVVAAGPKVIEVAADGLQSAGTSVGHFGARALDAQNRMDSEARASDKNHYSDQHPDAATSEFSQIGSAPEAVRRTDEAQAAQAARQIVVPAQQQPLPDDPNIHVR